MINYFCCNLYCFIIIIIIIIIIMLWKVFDFRNCSIDIRLFVLYCVCLCVMCFLLYLTSFVTNWCNDIICGPTKWYVCMYTCVCNLLYPKTRNTHKHNFIKKSQHNEGLNADKYFIGFVGITADNILAAVPGWHHAPW